MEEGLMLVVGWYVAPSPSTGIHWTSSVDMSTPVPDPPLTREEMEPVAFAAKMALAKVLRARKKRKT